jgi:hypothetical protein
MDYAALVSTAAVTVVVHLVFFGGLFFCIFFFPPAVIIYVVLFFRHFRGGIRAGFAVSISSVERGAAAAVTVTVIRVIRRSTPVIIRPVIGRIGRGIWFGHLVGAVSIFGSLSGFLGSCVV